VGDPDRIAFEKTVSGLVLPRGGDLALDATIVPEGSARPTLREPAPLPTIPVRYPGAEGGEVELQLSALLGEGGMGQVYLATQRSLGREVAVKTVRRGEPDAVAALCDEAVVTGRLSHPNVIPVHALARDDRGRPLLVMKRVEGVPWDALLHDPAHPFWKKNDVAGADRLVFHVEVLRQVAHAVAFAHSRGIVHRDIKPENVMIGDFGETYLVDWGIAARIGTPTGDRIAGTPVYLAPEMVEGVVDERTDVYLLGATLHEILTGAPPHHGTTLQAMLFSAYVSQPPTLAPDVPPELAELCTRALARAPEDRPASAAAFGDALTGYLRHRGSRALSRTGEARLETLRRAVEDVRPEARDLAELRRLVAECRFAFLEARRGWPENPDVLPGLSSCLRLATRVEIDRRDAQAARAALSELGEDDPALERDLAALEADLARDAEEHARLQRMAHDLDPSVDAGPRVAAAFVALALIVVVGGWGTWVERTRGLRLGDLLGFSLATLVGLGAILGLLRKRILNTTFNRRVAGWVAICILLEVVHRVIAAWTGLETVGGVLATDLLVLAAVYAMGALFLFRWMLPAGLALCVAAAPALMYPRAALTLLNLATTLAAIGFVLGWRRSKRMGEEPATTRQGGPA
jgi:tRNA A-37 threonylcarbamoyl transferase component Bud32